LIVLSGQFNHTGEARRIAANIAKLPGLFRKQFRLSSGLKLAHRSWLRLTHRRRGAISQQFRCR
jgi:hypothetical protein